jgi:hypothetical protein
MEHIPKLKKSAKKIHHALFETFTYLNPSDQNSTTASILANAEENSFKMLSNEPDLKKAFLILANLHILHCPQLLKLHYQFGTGDKEEINELIPGNLIEIKDFIHKLPQQKKLLTIYDISRENRLKLFTLLLHSDSTLLRKLGFYVRLFYLNAIYNSPLSDYISGIAHPHQKAPTLPKFPKLKTHLKYNAKTKTLNGKIDVLIIGSGASASAQQKRKFLVQ